MKLPESIERLDSSTITEYASFVVLCLASSAQVVEYARSLINADVRQSPLPRVLLTGILLQFMELLYKEFLAGFK